MRYRIESNGVVLGATELEHADPSMGMLHGVLMPSKCYSQFKPLFDDYYQVVSRLTGVPGEVRVPELRVVSAKIDDLKLTLFCSKLGLVPVECIEIDDCTSEPELSDENIRVRVIFKSSEMYEKFFAPTST